MRKILILIGVMVSMLATAAPIDQTAALKEAQAFLNSRCGAQTGAKLRLAKQSAKIASAKAEANYYIFNVGDNNGFVIVSGDDRTGRYSAIPIKVRSTRRMFQMVFNIS